MKLKQKMIMFAIVLVLSTLLLSCSTHKTAGVNEIPLINLSTLAGNEETLVKMAEDLQKGEDVIVLIPAGYSLPVHMIVNSPVAHMDSADNRLVFDQDVYMHMSQKGMKLSPDGENWSEFKKVKNLKTLFGIKEGSFSVGISAEKESEPGMTVSLDLMPVE